jgi:sterol desaturase/sphingolipid hydroxylase (fatty acid hydroxylase superfamily)
VILHTSIDDVASLEPWVRSSIFLATISTLAVAERLRPRRPNRSTRSRVTNVALLLLNTLLVRAITTTSLVAVAATAQTMQWGALTRVAAPTWIEFAIAIVLLDAGMYLQHRLFHWVPWFWRLHAVHHSDTAFDLTTGIRFHPGEILVSLAIKAAMVVALGASPWAVLTFEALLSSASLFEHSNVRIAPRFDAPLRRVIVTPDVHRVHHSIERDEHNSNFGFLLLWWDRLFRTYSADPRGDPSTMPIGLSAFRSDEDQQLHSLIVQPFSAR